MILRSFFQHDLPLFPAGQYVDSLFACLSLLLLSPSFESVQREAKVEANHHAITAPGAANSDPFSESSNRLLPPWGIHHCGTGIAKPTIFILSSAGKKGLSTLHPLLRLFSPNHRRADRSADYWHPGNPSREWRRFHFENRSTDLEHTY